VGALAGFLALAQVGAPAASAPARAAALESTRALASGLARTGRAEATLSWTVLGPPGSPARSMRGTLAVEPPDLARLDVAGSGERVTLRADGGEWLQPELKQFVRLTPRHSVAAMRWWRLLAGSTSAGGGGYDERKLAPGHYRLLVPATPAADADSADVWLDAGGLPARLTLADGMGGESGYRLSGWRFTRAKGATAFRLTAPPGVETVELP
jgi:outer membrane lipoprotein-sorting protein